MANELNLRQTSGLTMTATVHSLSGVQQGSTTNMTEVSSGQYSGDFSVIALSDGQYSVNFVAGGVSVGFGEMYVRNGSEVTQEQFELKAEADVRQTALIAEHDQTQADVATRASQASVDAIPTSVPTAVQNADAVWSKVL